MTDDLFFIWEHDEKSPKRIIDQVNMFHPMTKFTAEYSKDKVIL